MSDLVIENDVSEFMIQNHNNNRSELNSRLCHQLRSEKPKKRKFTDKNVAGCLKGLHKTFTTLQVSPKSCKLHRKTPMLG